MRADAAYSASILRFQPEAQPGSCSDTRNRDSLFQLQHGILLPSVSSFLCMLVLVLLMHIRHEDSNHSALKATLAGAAASLAIMVKASTLYVIPCYILYLLSCTRGRRVLVFFLAGCTPAGLFQLYYNWSCFGGLFESSYAHANPAIMNYENAKLLGPPTLRRLLELTILPLLLFWLIWIWLLRRRAG